jgi:hypothetical protein
MAEKRKKPAKADSSSQAPAENDDALVNFNQEEVENYYKLTDEIFDQRCRHILENLNRQVREGLSNPDGSFSIHSIERLLGEAKYKLSKLADDILQSELSRVDEQKLIKLKKKNSKPKA